MPQGMVPRGGRVVVQPSPRPPHPTHWVGTRRWVPGGTAPSLRGYPPNRRERGGNLGEVVARVGIAEQGGGCWSDLTPPRCSAAPFSSQERGRFRSERVARVGAPGWGCREGLTLPLPEVLGSVALGLGGVAARGRG